MTIGDDGRTAFELAMARDPGVPEQETNEPPETPAAEAPEAAAPETEADTDARERDATGKFVAKKEGEENEPPAERQAGIPSARLREESEAKRVAQAERDDFKRKLEDMERQLVALRQPPIQRQQPQAPQQPPPNIFENPDGYVDQRLRPIQDGQTEIIDRFSRLMAVNSFGREAVDAALKELTAEVQSNPTARFEAQRIWQSEHPYGALVEWHKGRETLRQIGNDPQAYQQKMREQLLNDPDFVKQVIEKANGAARQAPAANGNGRSTPVALPPSMSSRNGASASSDSAPGRDPGSELAGFFPR